MKMITILNWIYFQFTTDLDLATVPDTQQFLFLQKPLNEDYRRL